MKTYPAIALAARHGRHAAIAIGVLALLITLIATTAQGGFMPFAWALLAGVLAWAVARLLAELIEVIADTLLPR
ncbi:MAG: hypothetical protein EXR39_12160 [Betaproteobacteria bacterium]|nr:hypothetical protein [Betaproteobacteria bacterium]